MDSGAVDYFVLMLMQKVSCNVVMVHAVVRPNVSLFCRNLCMGCACGVEMSQEGLKILEMNTQH